MHKRFVGVLIVLSALMLNVVSFIVPQQASAATLSNTTLKWTTQLSAGSGAWQSIIWSPEQGKFVAVASASTFPFAITARGMTSTDAKSWALSTMTGTRPLFMSVAWSPSLNMYAAVSCADITGSACQATTTSSSVATSPDGVTWTTRTNPDATANWRSITWAPGVGFVAVADSGTNRVMTSSDGITWTGRTASQANAWRAVTWSSALSKFVAVATSGTNRVMTSPDGITWTNQTAAEANSWDAVTWSPNLSKFVAVSIDGTNRVMTSPDGITWTPQSAPGTNTWSSVVWSPELSTFVAVANSGTNRVMTSPDGITWTAKAASVDNAWNAVAWAPALQSFVAVASSGANNGPPVTGSYRTMTGSMITAGTDPATSVAARSATFHGNYTDKYAGANVFFRYRVAGSGGAFTDTIPQAVTAEGNFTANASGLTPNTNYEYKAVVQWTSAAGTETLEGGLQTFTTPLADDDSDGVFNVIEDAAPNGGDANNDGILDSAQPNIASYINGATGKYAVLALDNACQINTAATQPESANAMADLLYQYPLGLTGFTANCGTPGFTAHASLYYFGADNVAYIARKYNPITKTYTTFPGVTTSSVTIGGQAALQATYTITDGGAWDTDGAANGIIVDPIGLSQLLNSGSTGTNSSGSPLANTGTSVASLIGLSSLLSVSGGATIYYIVYRERYSAIAWEEKNEN